jgi:hypothetical protein
MRNKFIQALLETFATNGKDHRDVREKKAKYQKH